MIRLLTITFIVICLAVFHAAEAKTVSTPLCAFAPLREHSLPPAHASAPNIFPAKAQRRKEESLINSGCAGIGFWHGAPGSTINVYVATSEFDEDEIAFLLAPLTTWNAASCETGSRVKFEYKGLTPAPLSCTNCLTITRVDEGVEPVDDDTPIVLPKP